MDSSTCHKKIRLDTDIKKVVRVDLKKFEKLLKCPQCLKFCIPPVYVCKTGHNVCDKCQITDIHTRVKKCGICSTDILTTKNFFYENVCQIFSCIYKAEGCEITGSLTNLKVHEELCEFRPFNCEMCSFSGKNLNVSYSKYLDHFGTAHGIKIVSSNDGEFKIRFDFCHKTVQELKPGDQGFGIPCTFKFQGYIFFIWNRITNSSVDIWVSIFGNEVQAKIFNVPICIESSIQNSDTEIETKQRKLIGVHSFRSTWQAVKNSGLYLSATMPDIRAVCAELPNKVKDILNVKGRIINDVTSQLLPVIETSLLNVQTHPISTKTKDNSNFDEAVIDIDTKKLERLLKCPVCLEICIPPIHICNAGHDICNKCHKGERIKKCVICSADFKGTQNKFFEDLYDICDFSCIYEAEGCKLSVSGLNLKTHQEQCDFRPLECQPCYFKGKLLNVSYSKYLDHIAAHSGEVYSSVNGEFEFPFIFKHLPFSLGHDRRTYWKTRFFKFQGNTFLVSADLINSVQEIWVSLFGSHEEATKFYVQMSIGNSMENSDNTMIETKQMKPSIGFEGKVHSIRSTPQEVKNSGMYLMTAMSFIRATWTELPNKGGGKWKVKGRIINEVISQRISGIETSILNVQNTPN